MRSGVKAKSAAPRITPHRFPIPPNTTHARIKIEKLTGKKCYLELFVSIKKGWTKNKQGLKELGYDVTF